MGLHYHKHQQNYLNKLNTLLSKNNYNYQYSLEQLVNHINEFPVIEREDILYNLGGVLNHNLYWKSMGKDRVNVPSGSLLKKIESQYGSFENFKDEFKKMAMELKGSGYTFLVVRPDNVLMIINTVNQVTPLYFGYIPLFNIDMWEHAYYLNYKNEKEKYIDNFFDVADFTNASLMYKNINK